ncbi:MAG: hypothetical protein IK086_08000, partial [Clostridia bacterium]|nr:hypothetical protein [Clostridia bacterium]
YLPVLIISGIYLLCGFYKLEEHNLFWWLAYPTNYHFVASIVLLYIPYYFIMKIETLRDRLPAVFGIILLAHILVYIFAYDKTYYHIDTVREPMIWFLFMEAMLIGAWFRQNDIKFRNKFHWYYIPMTVVLIVLYFGSKLAVSKYAQLSSVQILNQFVLLLLLVSVFLTVSSIDGKLGNMPNWLKKPISFISEMTLEIYVCRSVCFNRFIKRYR